MIHVLSCPECWLPFLLFIKVGDIVVEVVVGTVTVDTFLTFSTETVVATVVAMVVLMVVPGVTEALVDLDVPMVLPILLR